MSNTNNSDQNDEIISNFGFQTIVPLISKSHDHFNSIDLTDQKLHSNISLEKSLELPAVYGKEELSALQEAAFKRNRKILKVYKQEINDFRRKIDKKDHNESIDPNSDPNLLNSFVMIPNEYVSTLNDSNSLIAHALSIDPSLNIINMPDVVSLDDSKENIWKNTFQNEIRQEWLKERIEKIKSFPG